MRSIAKLTLATVAAAASVLALAAPALASGGGGGNNDVIRADVVGSVPGEMVGGIASGGAAWTTTHDGSEARVRSDGRIDVRLRGLVLTSTITPALPSGSTPFASVFATLVCDDMAVASTQPFADGADGVGRTRDMLTLPASCGNPVVLIQPVGRAIFIGLTMVGDND